MPFYIASNTVTAAMTLTTNLSWGQWTATTAATSITEVWNAWSIGCTPDQYAQLEAHFRAHDVAVRQQQERARKRSDEIAARAHELLLSYLDEKQRANLASENWFLVDGKSGTRYRIKRGGGLIGNVEVLNADGSVRHRLCAHDREAGTPLDDQLLTQKFYLEHHEQEFLSVANRH